MAQGALLLAEAGPEAHPDPADRAAALEAGLTLVTQPKLVAREGHGTERRLAAALDQPRLLAEQAQTRTRAGHAVKAVVAVVAAIPAAWVVLAAKVGSARVAGVEAARASTSPPGAVVTAATVIVWSGSGSYESIYHC